MKKVYLIHGFRGRPNGGWRPYLMKELAKKDIYTFSLSMPKPNEPILSEWLEEIDRYIERNKDDEIYLVGHSLGCPAIINYLNNLEDNLKINSVFLVSGPFEKLNVKNENSKLRKVNNFLEPIISYEKVKSKANNFFIIHGDDDDKVPLQHGEKLAEKLDGKLIVVKGGKHLNGSAGFTQLPELLEVILKMVKND